MTSKSSCTVTYFLQQRHIYDKATPANSVPFYKPLVPTYVQTTIGSIINSNILQKYSMKCISKIQVFLKNISPLEITYGTCCLLLLSCVLELLYVTCKRCLKFITEWLKSVISPCILISCYAEKYLESKVCSYGKISNPQMSVI